MENTYPLQDHLCFSLYACSRSISRMYQPMLEKLDLTYPQYLVLVALWEQDGRSVKDLGDALDLDSGTLTPMLKRMEAKHLISRQRSKEDERVVTVHLTDKGAALQKDAQCIPLSLIASSGMTSEEFQVLNESIHKLQKSLVK